MVLIKLSFLILKVTKAVCTYIISCVETSLYVLCQNSFS